MTGHGHLLPCVTVHDRFADLPERVRLGMTRAVQPYFFDRINWLENLYFHCLSDQTLRIAHATDGHHDCLYAFRAIGRLRIENVSNWYSFRADPVFSPGCPPDRAVDLLTALFRTLAGETAKIGLYPVAASSSMAAALRLTLREAGWHVIARPLGSNRRIAIPPGQSFAQYWVDRPGQLRSTFARKSARYPVDITISRTLTDGLWRDVQSVFAASWKADGDNWPFLEALAGEEAAAGTLRLGLARLDGRPVAVELWTVENGTALIHKLAYADDAAQASPGTQLTHAMFKSAIDEDKVRTIDFGTGDTPYKALWMPDATDLLRLDAYRLRDPRCWLPAARAAISAWRGRR